VEREPGIAFFETLLWKSTKKKRISKKKFRFLNRNSLFRFLFGDFEFFSPDLHRHYLKKHFPHGKSISYASFGTKRGRDSEAGLIKPVIWERRGL
jgi:hypothetical protein